ncbi:MAG: HNH endonuclease signature motif containing protein, partial [Myxococcaceae bacterium]
GELSARKAQCILPVALGEHEELWISRAREMTVRELEAVVRAARSGVASGDESDERWNRVEVLLTPAQRKTVDYALELARKVVGHAAPRWQLLETLCEEFLSEHPEDEDVRENETVLRFALNDALLAAKEGLEFETRRWAALERVDGVAAPESDAAMDPFALDARLRELAAMRKRWDGLVGHLALLVRMLGLWRDMGFANFGHYCTERLQMAPRTVEQRAALEQRLHALPALRQALVEGRVSYEQARIIARHADERSLDVWLERAQRMTCIQLAREAESATDAQMCSSGWLHVDLPSSTTELLDAACRAVRRAAGAWVSPGDCLERIARHFIDTWALALRRRTTVQTRVVARDGGWCQVPVCSRPAVHVHHITFRSHGGSDAPENLVSTCAAHHLHGLHAGYIRVEGHAPDGLTWELGLRPGFPPLMVFAPEEAPPREVHLRLAA